MKKIEANAKVEVNFSVNFELTVTEAKALIAITEYGLDAFLKVFYENLGKSSLQPFEFGVKSLFHSIREVLPKEVSKIDKANLAIKEALKDF